MSNFKTSDSRIFCQHAVSSSCHTSKPTRSGIRVLRPPGEEDQFVAFGAQPSKDPEPSPKPCPSVSSCVYGHSPRISPRSSPPKISTRLREDSSEMAQLMGHTSELCNEKEEEEEKVKKPTTRPLRPDQVRKMYHDMGAGVRGILYTDRGDEEDVIFGQKCFPIDVFDFWPRKRHYPTTQHDSPVVYSLLHKDSNETWEEVDELKLSHTARRTTRNDSQAVASLLDSSQGGSTVWYPQHRLVQLDASNGDHYVIPRNAADDSFESHRWKQQRLRRYPNYQNGFTGVVRPSFTARAAAVPQMVPFNASCSPASVLPWVTSRLPDSKSYKRRRADHHHHHHHHHAGSYDDRPTVKSMTSSLQLGSSICASSNSSNVRIELKRNDETTDLRSAEWCCNNQQVGSDDVSHCSSNSRRGAEGKRNKERSRRHQGALSTYTDSYTDPTSRRKEHVTRQHAC